MIQYSTTDENGDDLQGFDDIPEYIVSDEIFDEIQEIDLLDELKDMEDEL